MTLRHRASLLCRVIGKDDLWNDNVRVVYGHEEDVTGFAGICDVIFETRP